MATRAAQQEAAERPQLMAPWRYAAHRAAQGENAPLYGIADLNGALNGAVEQAFPTIELAEPALPNPVAHVEVLVRQRRRDAALQIVARARTPRAQTHALNALRNAA